MEAIDYQGKSQLAIDLVGIITELQKNERTGQIDLQDSKIAKVIKKHTGLTIKPNIDIGYSAAILPQTPSRNNVLFKSVAKYYYQDTEADKEIFNKGFFNGTIDLENSKATGDFGNLLSQVYLGEKLLNKDSLLSPEEVTAVILHEIGHYFVALEMLTRITKTNYVMHAASDQLLKSETKKQRMMVLDQLENYYDDKIKDKERIAEIKKHKDYYGVLILTSAINNSINQLGYNVYDMRSYEQLSDQFSNRHGMGIHLVTALDKLHRRRPEYYRDYHSKGYHYLMWVMNALTFMMGGYFSFLIGGLKLLSGYLILSFLQALSISPNEVSYDPPKKRFEKIRNDLISISKDPNLSVAEKDEIINDIKVIDEMRAKLHDDNYYFTELVWNKILPWGRDEQKKIVFNEELERLLNNALFLSTNLLHQHIRKS